MRKRDDDFNDDIDALFKLPLAEFTGARNALAAQLKKSGNGDEAVRVKALAKPSISAWAVNQLYWNHRKTFDQLIALAERFHRAQKSGKVADMRASLDARREVLTKLSEIAAAVLQDAGHNPSLDTIHRITTTLEGLSVYAARSDGPQPGRLTDDVDPPGFESFGSFVPRLRSVPPATKPGAGTTRADIPRPTQSKGSAKSDREAASARQKQDKHQLEETRKSKIAAARVSLEDARKSLTEARTRVRGLEAAQKKADAEAKTAEKHKQETEEELRKAKSASEDAARSARSIAVEVDEAVMAVTGAERTVEKASKELELLFRKSSGS